MTSRILAYINLTKPIVTASVFYTWLIAFLVASTSGVDVLKLALQALVIILGISWGNALNNYFDRDIDAIMRRTREKRPIPRGDLTVQEAKKFCIGLGVASLACTGLASWYFADPVTPVLYAIAILTYVYLYTVVLKRKTWTSILVAAIAYMCVLLHAWWCGRGTLDLPGLIIGLMGYCWVLAHLWAIAMHWAEDYALADVPTITVKFWRRPVVPIIALTLATVTTCVLALLPPVLGIVSAFYVPVVLSMFLAETAILIRIARLDWRTSKRLTYLCYKLTYPILALVFTALIVFRII